MERKNKIALARWREDIVQIHFLIKSIVVITKVVEW